MYDERKCPVPGCNERMQVVAFDGKSASSKGKPVYSCPKHSIPS